MAAIIAIAGLLVLAAAWLRSGLRRLPVPCPCAHLPYETLVDDLERCHEERLRMLSEVERLTRQPVPTSYACHNCGRRDGLDAGVTDELWEKLTGRTDGGGLLCLWCMDALAAEKGLTGFVMLHFAGRALAGADGPTVWDDHELTEQLLLANDRCVRAVQALTDWKLEIANCTNCHYHRHIARSLSPHVLANGRAAIQACKECHENDWEGG